MIQELMGVFIPILCCLGYLWAVTKCCKAYLEISPRREKLFVIVLFTIGILLNAIDERYHVPNILFALLSHICLIGLMLVLFQGDAEKKILIASILITVSTLAGNFFASFFAVMALVWMHTWKHISVPFLNEWEISLIACVSLIIEILAIYGMSKRLRSVLYGKTRKWYLLLALPLFAVTIVIDMANWGASEGIMVRSGGNMNLYYDQIFSDAEICVLTMLSMFATGFYVFGMNEIYLEQEKSGRYYSQIAAYKMLEEQYRQSERLRHDMKNHVFALSGLLENKEWEKMSNYLKSMKESAGFVSGEEITGNRVVDALLYQKRKLAEEKGIIWEWDVQMPKICCISEFDLCVLFGNVLDNALEACERLQYSEERYDKDQFINIQARAVKKCFLLEVKNSAGILDKNKSGLTNKKNPKRHGIGLLNVRDIVYKYNGIMNIEFQNGIFVISILVPFNDAGHDIKQAV